jgi:hypothetical protein
VESERPKRKQQGQRSRAAAGSETSIIKGGMMGHEVARVEDIDSDIRLAKALAQSGFYKDIRDAAAGVVKLRIAREFGLGIKGISDVHIVEGKPTLSYQAILGMVRAYTGPLGTDRYSFRYTKRDEECVEIEWLINNEVVGTSKCDTDDAKRMGVLHKKNWERYPRQMRTARAVTEGVNAFIPEVIGGSIYTPEELGDDSGVMVSSSVVATAEGDGGGAITSLGAASSPPTLTIKAAEESEEDKAERFVAEATATMDAAEETLEGEVIDPAPDWVAAARKFFNDNPNHKTEYAELLRNYGYLPEGKLTAKKIYETLAETLGPRCLELDIVMKELQS